MSDKHSRATADAAEALWKPLGSPEWRLHPIADVIQAAEERGRRAGIEERDEYARALYDLFMSIPPPQNPRWQEAFTQAFPLIGRIKREALAPRDSGKEARK